MWIEHEKRRCPVEFQARLTRRFGLNRFGQPNFKIVWGQTELHRMGNIWRDKFGNERREYRQRYLAHGMPCWVLLRWKAPEAYGSPALFYDRTWSAQNKMYDMGEYPYRGRYEVVQAFHWKEMVPGKIVVEIVPCQMPDGKVEEVPLRRAVGQKMVIHAMPLSHVLIDKIIPMLLEAQKMTVEERRAAQALEKERQEKEMTDEIAERLADGMPCLNPISYSRQGVRTSLLDRKMEQIQKVWNRILKSGAYHSLRPGFRTGHSPLARARAN